MFDLLARLDGWAQWLIVVGGGIAVIAAGYKWVRPRVHALRSDARAIRDTLVGREAQRDSITGEIIPGTKIDGIGVRVSSIEKQGQTTSEQLGILTRAVADMARNQDRIDALEHRVSAIESGAFLERLASKYESIQLLSTIETAVKADAEENQ